MGQNNRKVGSSWQNSSTPTIRTPHRKNVGRRNAIETDDRISLSIPARRASRTVEGEERGRFGCPRERRKLDSTIGGRFSLQHHNPSQATPRTPSHCMTPALLAATTSTPSINTVRNR